MIKKMPRIGHFSCRARLDAGFAPKHDGFYALKKNAPHGCGVLAKREFPKEILVRIKKSKDGFFVR